MRNLYDSHYVMSYSPTAKIVRARVVASNLNTAKRRRTQKRDQKRNWVKSTLLQQVVELNKVLMEGMPATH